MDHSSSDHKCTKSTVPIEILDHNDDADDISLMYTVPSSSSVSSSSLSNRKKTKKGTTPDTAILVENYSRKRALINLDYYYYSETSLEDVTEISPSSLPKKPETLFTCEICAEERAGTESFRITGCKHTYCSQCIISYVSTKLGDNVVKIRCPVSGCLGFLEPTRCRTILPPQVMDRWEVALCESSILESQKFYCPFKDCSALLLIDDNNTSTTPPGTTTAPPVVPQTVASITQSECPYCKRLFCAHCKAPWHQGIDCAEFQKLGKGEREREDIMLMQLAKNKKWARCSKCKFFVEKIAGCTFILCRCGNSFCYKCGTSTISRLCSCWKR